MADDRRRNRGRRRDRKPASERLAAAPKETPAVPPEPDEEPETVAQAEPAAPTAAKRATRSSSRPSGARTQAPRKTEQPSPLGFWRRSRTRSARAATGRQGKGSSGGPFGNMYFPPWAPVVGVMFIVFGLLVAVFIFRQTTGDPKVGAHWHARYEVTICDDRQLPIPVFEGPEGVHTHGDGVMHIHPFNTAGEGSGARLVKFFEYGGGELSKDKLRMPGETREYVSGQPCADGQEPAAVQVFVDTGHGETKLDNFTSYVPHDADSVRIVYGPPEAARTEGVGLVIPPTQATRNVSIISGDSGAQTESTGFFTPNAVNVSVNEIVRIDVRNNGAQSHNLRVAGGDGTYDTADDFVTVPLLLASGESGYVVVQFGTPGQYVFRCDIHPQVHTGVINVTGAATTPTATP